jgi:hypothetical protein
MDMIDFGWLITSSLQFVVDRVLGLSSRGSSDYWVNRWHPQSAPCAVLISGKGEGGRTCAIVMASRLEYSYLCNVFHLCYCEHGGAIVISHSVQLTDQSLTLYRGNMVWNPMGTGSMDPSIHVRSTRGNTHILHRQTHNSSYLSHPRLCLHADSSQTHPPHVHTCACWLIPDRHPLPMLPVLADSFPLPMLADSSQTTPTPCTYLCSLTHPRPMLGPVKVQHPILVTERVIHTELHHLHHVPGILCWCLLPQIHPGTCLGQPDQGLQLASRDGGGISTLPMLTQVQVEFL